MSHTTVAKQQKASNKRQTYYLVAGEIVFQVDEDHPPSTVRLNAVVMSSTGKFAVTQIARAQQTLQMQFYQRTEGANPKILDVVIIALMPLGEFTHEQFNAKPAGLEMVEVKEALGNG